MAVLSSSLVAVCEALCYTKRALAKTGNVMMPEIAQRFIEVLQLLSTRREEILTTLSFLISTLALFTSILALRYRRKQFDFNKQIVEEQKLKQRFHARIVDTYCHCAERDSWLYDGKIEYLGVILELDNLSENSVFVRYLTLTTVFSAYIREPSFGEILRAIISRLFGETYGEEALSYTIGYPLHLLGHRYSVEQKMALVPFQATDARYRPQCWVFDKRTDELVAFETPFEIRKSADSTLWELVVYVPPELGKAAQHSNLKASRMDILLILNNDRTQRVEGRFEEGSLQASSRERVEQLVKAAQTKEQ
jgi:hypothetical protein